MLYSYSLPKDKSVDVQVNHREQMSLDELLSEFGSKLKLVQELDPTFQAPQLEAINGVSERTDN